MHPWDRQSNETQKAHEAFLAYLGLEDRTHAACAQALGQDPERYRPAISRWSARYRWDERAREYDSWLAGQRMMARADVRVKRDVSIEEVKAEAYLSVLQHVPIILKGILDMATENDLGDLVEKSKGARVKLAAAQYALGLVGIVPVKRAELAIDLSGSLRVELTEAEVMRILDLVPEEVLDRCLEADDGGE